MVNRIINKPHDSMGPFERITNVNGLLKPSQRPIITFCDRTTQINKTIFFFLATSWFCCIFPFFSFSIFDSDFSFNFFSLQFSMCDSFQRFENVYLTIIQLGFGSFSQWMDFRLRERVRKESKGLRVLVVTKHAGVQRILWVPCEFKASKWLSL